MVPEKYKLIIEKLIDKTDKKGVIWTKTSGGNEFKLIFDKSSITIDQYGGDPGWADFIIYNEKGQQIDRIALNQEDGESYDLLIRLHESAKRCYYKVDETLDNIFSELEEKSMLGKEAKIVPPSDDDLPF